MAGRSTSRPSGAFRGVVVYDGLGRSWTGPSDIERPDAQAVLGTSDSRLGISVLIPAEVLGSGVHCLRFVGIDDAGNSFANGAEVKVQIVATVKPFPHTARTTFAPPPFCAHMSAVTPHEKRQTASTSMSSPSHRHMRVSSRTIVTVEGWAIDEDGKGADDVFIELCARQLHLPPYRLNTDCGRENAKDDVLEAPVEYARFHRAFSVPGSLQGEYVMALVVVQPERRTYSRVELATLEIDHADRMRNSRP